MIQNNHTSYRINKCFTILVICLFLAVIIQPINGKTTSLTLVVDQTNTDGPWTGSWDSPFQSIQDALENASGGETIFIINGSYKEHIIIDKPVKLHGLAKPVIHGHYHDSIITITSDNVNINNIICAYSGGKNTDTGIKLNDCHNISIKNSTFHHTRNAIFISNSTTITLDNNTYSNNGNAVLVTNSTHIMITQNHFAHNAIAIVLTYSSLFNLTRSTFIGNGMSSLFSSSNMIQISHCNLSHNSANKGGLFFESCSQCFIFTCLFHHNGDGISLSSSNNISITHCEFSNHTHFAISLRSPNSHVDIEYCNIVHNKRTGIYIEKNNSCTLSNSNINQNYLSDIAGDYCLCIATHNWWGSIVGPYQVKNDLNVFLTSVYCFPWSIHEIDNSGLQHQNLPPCKDISYEPDYSINFDEPDSDEDGIPDWWEHKWGYNASEWQNHAVLDPDHDALTNIQECYMDDYGANPYVKDIFLEIDWMKSTIPDENKPSHEKLQRIIDEFKNHNITLHIDTGSLGEGTEIPERCLQPSRYLELHNLYWTYFLNNSIQNPRKGIFRYGIICNYCSDLNFPFMGWDTFDSFAISATWLMDSLKIYERETIISGATMHQLGHTLGLIAGVHNGIDNVKTVQPLSKEWLIYLPYYSCMNYFYKYNILTYSDGSRGPTDFNDWGNLQFDFFQQSRFDE